MQDDFIIVFTLTNRMNFFFIQSGLSSFFSGRNKNIIKSGLTKEEKQRIVDLHNELRQKVAKGQETQGSPGPQPPAKDMPDVVRILKFSVLSQYFLATLKKIYIFNPRNGMTSQLVQLKNGPISVNLLMTLAEMSVSISILPAYD